MNDTQRFFVVGATLIAAVAGLTLALTYLRGNLTAARSTQVRVRFDDARGIQAGYQVRMAGIPIGTVQSVALVDRRAELNLRVQDQYPIPADSKFQIVTPLIGSTPFVQVVPGASPTRLSGAQPVEGTATTGVDTIMGRADSVMGKVDGILGDPQLQRDLRATVHNLRLASEELPRTLRQTQAIMNNAATISQQTTRLVPQLERQIANLTGQTSALLVEFQKVARTGNGVAREAQGLTHDMRLTLGENRAGIKALLRNTSDAVTGISALTGQLTEMLAGEKLQTKLGLMTDNLTQVTKNMVTISERLDATATEVQKLASDPALATDVKTTLANIRDTSASVKNLAARLETVKIPGERRPPSPTDPPRAPVAPLRPVTEPGLTFDTRYDTKAERLRNDVHFVLPSSPAGGFWRLGVTGATEGNRLDLQSGTSHGDAVLRYGLFAGKLGFGMDRSIAGLDLRLDLYDPNRFTADARIKKRLNADTSVLFGLDALGNGNFPVIGIQFKR